MNNKLITSIIAIIFVSLIIGIFFGYKLDNYFFRNNNLQDENEQLKSEIENLKSQSQSQCENLRGKWFMDGNGIYLCSLPTSDGGKECIDSDECEAECLAPEGAEVGMEISGFCSGETINYGYFVESGKVIGPVVD